MAEHDIVFITGATSGFGEACARSFAARGARLVLLGRRKERLQALGAELKVPCHLVVADVRDGAAIAEAVNGFPPDFRDVTILLNNAGLALGLGPAQRSSIEDWEVMVDTNIKGVLFVTRAVLPGMVERNRGHIINLGSAAASYPYPGGNVYGGTKAFLRQFSLNLKSDLVGTRVRVTDIEPGMARTEFSLVRFGGDAQKAEAVYQGMEPLSAQDIADTVVWCASRPAHVNINTVEIMPVAQGFGPFSVHRG